MLGNPLFDTLIYVIVGLWIICLLLLLSLSLIKKFFPKFEQSVDYVLLRSGKIILITMQISLLVAVILMIVWLITSD